MLCNAFCICVGSGASFHPALPTRAPFLPYSALSTVRLALLFIYATRPLRALHLTSVLQQMYCLLSSEVTLLMRQKLPSISNASRNTRYTIDEYKPLLFSCIQKPCCSCNKTLTAWIRRKKTPANK